MAGKTDLRVTIDADAAKLEREILRTQRSMMRLESQIRSTDRAAADLDREMARQAQSEQRQRQQQLRDQADAYGALGKGLLAFGAATAIGLGMSVKAAMDWESAWAGVAKVVEGTPAQLGKLEQSLRDLAKAGFAHEEVAAVAAAAGQLGIATDDVAEFTRVMLDMGVSTNLSAEQAAFALARMSNIMGTSAEDVERLGSTIVDLGNNSATTEAEIVEMALRIAGAGQTIGLSEDEVLALSAALSSVGINAEAGGSAISRVMIKIAEAVAEGGEAAVAFADVAGVSAQQFAESFQTDPARAIQTFVAGLGRINDEGGNVFATMENLGLSEIRTRDALLRMAGAGDLLSRSLDRGAQAWESNEALVKEAERRYQTAEVKIQAAKSTLVDLAIDIGSVLLPAFVELVQFGKGILDWFSDLPGPAKAAATVIGAVAGAVALLAGGLLVAGPRLAVLHAHFLVLKESAPKVAAGIRAVSLASGAIGIALVAAGAIIGAFSKNNAEAEARVSELSETLDEQTGAVTENTRVWAVNQLEKEGLLRQAQNLGLNLETLTDAMLGEERALALVRDRLEEIKSQSVGENVFGEQVVIDEQRFEAADRMLKQLGLTNEELAKAQEEHKRTSEAIGESTKPVKEVDDALINLAARFGETGEDAEEAAEKLLDEWREGAAKFISLTGAYGDALKELEDKERAKAESAAESTKSEKDTWEDFYEDVSVTIDDFIAKLDEQIEAQRNWQTNMAFLAGRVSDEMLAHLAELGPEGADLVQALVDGGTKKIEEADEKWRKATGQGTTSIVGELIKARPVLAQVAAEHGQKVADQLARHMAKRGVDVETAAKNLGIRIDKGVRDKETREIPVEILGENRTIEDINRIKDALNNIPTSINVAIDAQGNVRAHTPGGPDLALARGGPINGPGTPTSDSIPLWGSDGEWMVKAAARRKYGDRMMWAINEGVADVRLPGQGGRLSSVNINADSSGLDVGDFIKLRNKALSGAAQSIVSGSGKVLPPGSYRIGRGAAAHGYDARDLPAPIGTPIFAAAAGLVSRAARLATSYGIHAVLQHAGWRSLYAHMSQMYVSSGQQVARGQMLGRVGSTGNSTGPHLHLEPDNAKLYDNGGVWPTGTWGFNASGGDELVLDRSTTAAMGGKGDLPDVLKDLRNASQEMVAFAAALRKLRRRGLSESALKTIFESGPDDGGRQARAILRRGPAGIAEMNRWQRQQSSAERRAEGMFGDDGTSQSVFREISRNAGAGFIRGVVGSRDEIRDAFKPLFESIGKVAEVPARKRLMGLASDARRELLGLGRQWESVTARIERATDKLGDLRNEASQLRSSVRESIVGAVDVTQAMVERRRSDKDGGYLVEDRSIKAITETLRAERDKARQLASAVEKLRKRGLNDRTLQDIVAAGPEEGQRTANEILKGGKTGINQINVLTRQLNAAGRNLGDTAAKSMYGAGIRAAEGLVKGLRREERQIERMMQRIARSMVRSIKNQLKIKSPSQVFADEIGRPSIEGIAVGMLSAEGQVLAATRQIIDNAARQPWAAYESHQPIGYAPVPVLPAGATAQAAAAVGGDTWHVQGTSEEILHKLAARQAYAKYKRQRVGV